MKLRIIAVSLLVTVLPSVGHGQDHRDKKPAGPRPVQRVKPKEPTKDTTFKGTASHVYFNKKALTWKIGNDVLERTIQFGDDQGALRTTEIKTMGGVPRIDSTSSTEGEFSIVGADGKKRGPYRLDHDWAYIWQSVATPAHGGRLLTIHLQGIRSNDGIEIETLYEVYPGNRPYLAKSLTLINRGESPISLTDVVYDRWILPVPDRRAPKAIKTVATTKQSDFAATGDFSLGVEDTANRIGLRAFITSKQGEIAYENGTIIPRFAGPVEAPRRGGRAYAPFAVVFAYAGIADRGNGLYQKYDVALRPSEAFIKSRTP